MKVLVTGGVGFIGSHLVDALVAGGDEVVVLDSLVAHDHEPTLPPGVALVRGDVRDADAWRAAVAGVDAVSHQAARVGLGRDFGDVEDYVADNDLGTATGLRVLHEIGFRGRLVLAGSMVVYGEGAYDCPTCRRGVPAPERRAADLDAGRYEPRCTACDTALTWTTVAESTPPDPRSVYAATKLHQEHLVAAFGREHPEVRTVVLRYHNVYGPRMPRDTPYSGVAAIFRSALEAGRPPLVFEDGGQMRDFVHVADVATANVLALTVDAPGGTFNVASGEPRSVLDMATALHRAFADGDSVSPPPEVVGGYRVGDVRHVVASPELAATVLGFRPRRRFDEGVAELAASSLR